MDTKINGFQYAWEDIEVNILGRIIEGIVEVEYTTEKEHLNIYGRGAKPVSMGRGRESYSGKLVVLQSEHEAIQSSLPRGSKVTDLVFPITVSYAPAGGAKTTDILKYCRISKVTKGMKEGDGNMTIEYPLMIGDIDYNV